MKKEFAFLFLLFIIVNLFFSVSAQNTSISNKSDIRSVKEQTNSALEDEISIPKNLQILTRFLFGLEQNETITFQKFVILIAFWIGFFVILLLFVKLIPFFEGAKSFLATAIIMILIGISKGFKLATDSFFWAIDKINLLNDWLMFKLFVSLILIALFVFVVSKISNYLSSKSKIEKMERIGNNIGIAGEIGKIEKGSIK